MLQAVVKRWYWMACPSMADTCPDPGELSHELNEEGAAVQSMSFCCVVKVSS